MRLGVLALGLALAAPASAQDDGACGKFKWSVARERALFAAPVAVPATGALSIGDRAFRVVLADSVAFAVAPERAPKAGTHAAALSFVVAAPGPYDVTLSDEGWIDVAEQGRLLKANDFSGVKGCPGVRKSVRFDLAAGAATLQISNVEATTIDVAIVPAP